MTFWHVPTISGEPLESVLKIVISNIFIVDQLARRSKRSSRTIVEF